MDIFPIKNASQIYLLNQKCKRQMNNDTVLKMLLLPPDISLRGKVDMTQREMLNTTTFPNRYSLVVVYISPPCRFLIC